MGDITACSNILTKKISMATRFPLFFALLFVTLCSSATLEAQIDPGTLLSATSVAQSTSNYYFAKPNELTIFVSIVGFVQKPGRYEISNSIDLMNLLALAGGPTADGDLSDVKITRIVKFENHIARKEIRVNMQDLSKVSSAELTLYPGDVIHMDRTSWSGIRDSFTVLTTVAILTSAVVQVINLSK